MMREKGFDKKAKVKEPTDIEILSAGLIRNIRILNLV